MSRLFAVMRSRGSEWKWSEPLELQDEWASHAAFMDKLYADGFAVLVGPLEGSGDALIIARAESVEEVNRRLQGDPWTRNGLLKTTRVEAWTLRLGAL